MVEGVTGGDPMGEIKIVRRSLPPSARNWPSKATRLAPRPWPACCATEDFSLHVNVKRFTGKAHPDRDRQFRHLQDQIEAFRDGGWPIISVDTKKKELIGDFKNGGVEWGRQAEEVNCHDFLSERSAVRCPTASTTCWPTGVTSWSGTSADTPAFAVASMRGWWVRLGCKRYAAGAAADPGRRRGQQRLSAAAVEVESAGVGRPLRAAGDGVPLPDGCVEVEPDRAPAVRPDQHQLGGGAAAESGGDAGVRAGDDNSNAGWG